MQEKRRSRVIRVVEEAKELNVRFLNKIVRKIVWKKIKHSHTLYGTPTSETPGEEQKQTDDKKHPTYSSSRRKTFLHPKTVLETLQEFVHKKFAHKTREDGTSCVVNIVQVSETESKIEMLLSLKSQKKIGNRWNGEKLFVEHMLSRHASIYQDAEVTEKERKATLKMLPDSYDYRTLSTMQRSFQMWRPLEFLDESDGTAMGGMLMENTSGLHNTYERSEKRSREKLDWFFGQFRSMNLLKKEHPWFETMIEAVIVGEHDAEKTMAVITGGKSRDKAKLR